MALIYRIDGNDLTYVGSTTQTLNMRLLHHKCAYRKWKRGKANYITSFDILEHEHKITLIEECTEENIKEKEGDWIRTLNCVNKRIAGRTDKQYYQDNRKRIKQYRLDNSERNKEKFECPCGGRYTHQNKTI
tara:strand:+ start:3198 stop:3593 length:396 start_codon:yes stop_codon:yes gene_type:complete